MSKSNYIVIGNKPWIYRIFNEVISKYPGDWIYIESPERGKFQIPKVLKSNHNLFPSLVKKNS